MQMAMAYAALANGGTLYVPQVVERVESTTAARSSRTSRRSRAHGEDRRPRRSTCGAAACGRSNNEPGGTAYDHGYVRRRAGDGQDRHRRGHEARKQGGRDERDVEGWHPNASHAWFAGWAPAEDPEIAIVVLIEHGGSGGTVAWPIAEQILEGYFTARSKVAKPRRHRRRREPCAARCKAP